MGTCLGTPAQQKNAKAMSNFRKTSLGGSQSSAPGGDTTAGLNSSTSIDGVAVNIIDEFDGKIVIVYPNGDTYEGTMRGDKRHGQGLLLHVNHDMYEGGFKDDMRHGEGTFTYNDNGDVYTGEYVNDKRHGKGTYRWSTGDCYDGEWHENKKCGEGVMTYNDGDVYRGTWKDNKRNGNGTMTYHNGDEYVGEWFDGMKHGAGKMKWKNLECYDGPYVNDKKHGEGLFTKINGDVEEAIFVNDVMTTTSASPISKSVGIFNSPIGKLKDDQEYDPFVDRNHDEQLEEIVEKRRSLTERASLSGKSGKLSLGSSDIQTFGSEGDDE